MLSGTLDRQLTAYAVGLFEISDSDYDRQTQLVGYQLGGESGYLQIYSSMSRIFYPSNFQRYGLKVKVD